jgi:hypothetical protein
MTTQQQQPQAPTSYTVEQWRELLDNERQFTLNGDSVSIRHLASPMNQWVVQRGASAWVCSTPQAVLDRLVPVALHDAVRDVLVDQQFNEFRMWLLYGNLTCPNGTSYERELDDSSDEYGDWALDVDPAHPFGAWLAREYWRQLTSRSRAAAERIAGLLAERGCAATLVEPVETEAWRTVALSTLRGCPARRQVFMLLVPREQLQGISDATLNTLQMTREEATRALEQAHDMTALLVDC